MGTDIHMAAERRDPVTGKWHAVPPTPKLQAQMREEYKRWLDPASKDDQMSEWAQRKIATSWYDDRNYECFAILASVRNGSGFAGVITGDGFVPISEAKGLPCDASAMLRTPTNRDGFLESECDVSDIPEPDPDEEREDEFWLGYHDFSYLTLRELQDYDWEGQSTRLCGVIGWPEYLKRDAKGKHGTNPLEYSGGVSCQDCVTIEESVAQNLIPWDGRPLQLNGRLVKNPNAHLYVRVWWNESYAESAGRFYTDVLPELATIDPNPENVRIVFGFDS